MSMAYKFHHKLFLRYFGPFQIEKKISVVSFKIKITTNSVIHPIFHISVLKLYKGDLPPKKFNFLPELTVNNEPMIFPEEVFEERTMLVRGKPLEQLLIKWHDLEAENNSWEDKDTLSRLFPSINLEFKDNPMGDGNVRDTYRSEVLAGRDSLTVEDVSDEQAATKAEAPEEEVANDQPTTNLGRNQKNRRVRYSST